MRSFDAVVIGAGFTGSLAAVAAARGGARVLLVARNRTERPRDAAEVALLPWGSPRDIDMWAPDLGSELRAAGARSVPLPEGLVTSAHTPGSQWGPDYPKVFSSTRQLLDTALRANIAADQGWYGEISIREGTATGLVGSRHEITGIRAQFHDGDGAEQEVTARLVIDCSGHSSAASDWLTALGHPPIRHTTLTPELLCTWRECELPGVSPHIVWTRSAVLAPVENGKWVLAHTGEGRSRGPAEPLHLLDDRFLHINPAGSVGEPVEVRLPPRRIHHYAEERGVWPRGFVVLGDAVATHHPLHGRSSEMAQMAVEILHQELSEGGIAHPTLAERTQAAVGYACQQALDLSVKTPYLKGKFSRWMDWVRTH
ncbi:FAD-dependent oxidoreductase [Streptomyces sp. NPDC006798]|uniref:FAD-dependent oxidoreductase n=1 Tax=Streptomyces sp. NPDC006798 TaxID=3155462 RepID=UPI0034026711